MKLLYSFMDDFVVPICAWLIQCDRLSLQELFLDHLVERGVIEIPTEADEVQKETEEYLKSTQKAFEQGLMR